MGGDSVTLSMVLPTFNGAPVIAKHVPTLQQYLRHLGISFEIVVADDGTEDLGATAEVAARLGCRYVRNPVNQGKGAAVRRGMLAARGDFRIFTDHDVPYDLTTIGRFLHYLDDKEYHFVAGDRTLSESSYFTSVPLLRRAGSHLFATLVGRFVAGGWFDTQCGIKGFRGHVADDLFSVARVDRFAFDVELFYIALKRNYDIKRLPVRLRVQEGSSVRVLRDGAAMLRDLGTIRFHQLVGHYSPVRPVILGLDTSPRPDSSWNAGATLTPLRKVK
jgi:dolichyl-phosphate beta-glucosyltransferase